MTTQLIYRTEETERQKISPFDLAICKMVKGKDILIACPYIGVEYFQKILSSCSSWNLLTDIKAWIESSQRTPYNLPRILQFIQENRKNIRHYEDLHAKVIITPDQAFFGSVNLTKFGIDDREEMAVVISESQQVDELYEWFYGLWDRTFELKDKDLKIIDEYIADYLLWEKQHPARKNNPLKLKKPRKIRFTQNEDSLLEITIKEELPKDLPNIQSANQRYYSLRDLSCRIAAETPMRLDSARDWILKMIHTGRVQAYRFKYVFLLDKEGAETVWAARSRIQGRNYNIGSRGKYKIIEIADGELLTINDVIKATDKSRYQIMQLVENGLIQIDLRSKPFFFEPNVIELILSLELENADTDSQGQPNGELRRLVPLTKLQRFIMEHWKPEITDEQLIELAHDAGISRSINRQVANAVYHTVLKKQEAAIKQKIDLWTLDKTIHLGKPRSGRPRKKRLETV